MMDFTILQTKEKFKKLGTSMLVFLAFSLSGFTQQNIASLATVTADGSGGGGCRSGTCSTLNDLNFGSCNSQQMWLSTTPTASTPVGVDYIEWNFPSMQTFDSLIIHHGNDNRRSLTGATVQSWSGSAWITHLSFSNLPQQCINRIEIGKLTTNRFRITLFEMNGVGQASNPNFREIEVIEAPTAPNDAGILALDSPKVFCVGSHNVLATIRNFGSNQIDSVNVFWEVDGVLQGTHKIVGLLDTMDGAFTSDTTIQLGTYMFQTVVEVKVYTDLPNNRYDTISQNDTLIKKIGPGLSGVYTVDANLPVSTTNFQKIKALTNSLNLVGVCGPTVIKVANAVYNESLYLKDIPGASAINPILIDGGDSSKTIVTQDGSQEFATLTFDGTKHVRVQNMTFEMTGKVGDAVIFANAKHNTLSNCATWVDPTSTISTIYNIVFSANASTNTNGALVDYNIVQNNRIIGGYYGIRAYGSTLELNAYNKFYNNTIDSTLYYGAQLYYQDSVEFVGNSINMLSRGKSNANGIYIYYANNTRFSQNNIWAVTYAANLLNTNTYAPIKRRYEVSNNMLYAENGNGLRMYYVDSADIWHNSVNVKGVSPAAIFYGASNNLISTYDVRNNIFSADKSYALETNMPDTMFVKFDHNIYNTNGMFLLNITGLSYSDLASYVTAQPEYNGNSIESDPEFISATDMHIIGTVADEAGDNSVGVIVDIDNDERPNRNASIVDIGADEFFPPACPPVINLSVNNVGITSADISWTSSSLIPSFEYIIVPCGDSLSSGTGVGTNLDSHKIRGLNIGTCYDLYVREVCGSRDNSIWKGPKKINTRNPIPFFEDFESFGKVTENPWPNGWTSSTAVNPKWESGSGTTPSVNTGPNADHTVGTSSGTYVFFETSGGVAGSSADFVSPKFFVDSTQTVFKLSYWYHFYGATVNGLDVIIESNGVENVITTIRGQQHRSTSAPWLKDSISIRGYQGKTITLKFRGRRGTSHTGDIAIDDVRLDATPAIDGTIIALNKPLESTTHCYTASESVNIELYNNGSGQLDFTVNSADITLNVSGAVTKSLTLTVNDNSFNYGNPLEGGKSMSIPLGTIDMRNVGSYFFDAIVNIVADDISENDVYLETHTTLAQSGGVISGINTICKGDTVILNVDNTYGETQWQRLDGSSWVDIFAMNVDEILVGPLKTTNYRVISCGNASAASSIFVLEVVDLSAPSVIGDTAIVNCDDLGTAKVIPTKTYPNSIFVWYDSLVNGNEISTGGKLYVSDNGDTLTYTAASSSYRSLSVEEIVPVPTQESSLLITEFDPGNPDMLEIQNVSGRSIDVTGWSLAVSDNYANINVVNSKVKILNGTWAPNQIEYWDDGNGPNSWGNNIFWSEQNNPGWILLIDDLGNIVDFVIWKWTAAEMSRMRVLINNFTITPGISGAWNGHGVNINSYSLRNSFSRIGRVDHDDLTDFVVAPITTGVINAKLMLPFREVGCASARTMVSVGIECLVGLEDLASVEVFEIYPNPSNGLFTLNIRTERSENIQMTIRDAQGKLIHAESVAVNGTYRGDMDLSSFAKGVYYVQIQTDKESKIEKLIIQ